MMDHQLGHRQHLPQQLLHQSLMLPLLGRLLHLLGLVAEVCLTHCFSYVLLQAPLLTVAAAHSLLQQLQALRRILAQCSKRQKRSIVRFKCPKMPQQQQRNLQRSAVANLSDLAPESLGLQDRGKDPSAAAEKGRRQGAEKPHSSEERREGLYLRSPDRCLQRRHPHEECRRFLRWRSA